MSATSDNKRNGSSTPSPATFCGIRLCYQWMGCINVTFNLRLDVCVCSFCCVRKQATKHHDNYASIISVTAHFYKKHMAVFLSGRELANMPAGCYNGYINL